MQFLAKVQVIDGALSCETCEQSAIYLVSILRDCYDAFVIEPYCKEHYQALVKREVAQQKKKARERENAQRIEADYQSRLAVGSVSDEERQRHDRHLHGYDLTDTGNIAAIVENIPNQPFMREIATLDSLFLDDGMKRKPLGIFQSMSISD